MSIYILRLRKVQVPLLFQILENLKLTTIGNLIQTMDGHLSM